MPSWIVNSSNRDPNFMWQILQQSRTTSGQSFVGSRDMLRRTVFIKKIIGSEGRLATSFVRCQVKFHFMDLFLLVDNLTESGVVLDFLELIHVNAQDCHFSKLTFQLQRNWIRLQLSWKRILVPHYITIKRKFSRTNYENTLKKILSQNFENSLFVAYRGRCFRNPLHMFITYHIENINNIL